MGKKKITYKDVDWELYRDNVEANISNERIWGLGGSSTKKVQLGYDYLMAM